MKFIDILSDKIDYLFRRSKNADERTYDFFIRTVTFLILALIILCYGSFVHADGNTYGGTVETGNIPYVITLSDSLDQYSDTYGSDAYNPLLGSALYYTYPNYSYMSEEFILNYSFPTSVNGRVFYGSINSWVNVEADSSSCYMLVVPCNRSYYIEGSGNINFLTNDTVCSFLVFFVDKTNQYITQRGVNGCYIKNFDNTLTYTACPTVAVSYDTSNGSYTYGVVDTSKSGNGIDLGSIVYTNAPVFTIGSGISSSDFTNTEYSSIINTVYGNDMFIQSNPLILDGSINNDGSLNGGSSDPVESARNHLYLEDFQIGLSATTNLADLMSSDVIIGISGDDYIQNHPDEFEIWIDYHVMLKDSITGVSDPDVHYSYYYPARTFLNGVYSMGINEIFEHMTLSNNTSLYNYYRNLKDTYNQKVVADGQTFVRGLFPDLYKTLWEHYIGGYYVDNAVTTNNTIFNFDFEVSVAIRESGSNNISGIGTKKFDFLNGTESITTASVLQNHDPWEGESDPQMSPAVPSTGSSISSGSGGGGSVNVKVDVSGQKIPLGVKTKAQMEEILKNYRDVYGEFDSNWYTLADQNNDNNFLKILGLTLPEIPAIDYMVQCACVIFGLAVVLFVLKVLLF